MLTMGLKMLVSEKNILRLLPLIYGMLIFLVTFVLAYFYTGGDQVHYIKAYDRVYKLTFIDAYIRYNNLLSSQEFIHFILIWTLGEYAEKNLVMSFANGMFAYLATVIMLRLNANKWIVLLILVFSYYPLVLFLAAERLKFGFILFFFSMMLYQSGKAKLALVAASISITAHIQLLISYASVLLVYLVETISTFIRKGVVDKKIIYIVILGGLSLYFMSGQIIDKFDAHVDGFALVDLMKILVLFALILFYTPAQPSTAVVLFIPLFVVTILMGAERIIFFGYFIFLYYGLQVKGGVNVGVVITLLYGFYKTSLFLFSLYFYGHGFAL